MQQYNPFIFNMIDLGCFNVKSRLEDVWCSLQIDIKQKILSSWKLIELFLLYVFFPKGKNQAHI